MKKLIVLLGVVSGLMAATQTFAGETAVGVVNVGQILHSSQQVKDATNVIQDKFAKRQDAIKTQQDELQMSMDQFKKDSAVMKDEDKKALQEKIEKQRKQLLDDIAAFQKELSTEQSESMKTIFNQLNKVIEQVAKEQKLDVVLDSQFVVYAGDKQDITEQVKQVFSAPAAAEAK